MTRYVICRSGTIPVNSSRTSPSQKRQQSKLVDLENMWKSEAELTQTESTSGATLDTTSSFNFISIMASTRSECVRCEHLFRRPFKSRRHICDGLSFRHRTYPPGNSPHLCHPCFTSFDLNLPAFLVRSN